VTRKPRRADAGDVAQMMSSFVSRLANQPHCRGLFACPARHDALPVGRTKLACLIEAAVDRSAKFELRVGPAQAGQPADESSPVTLIQFSANPSVRR
jgi:hypothetical protein